MKQPRERNPAATRAALISATQALILRQGVGASSVEQICTEAGFTKGSFFHHFASKDAICLAAIDAWAEMGAALYAPAWEPGPDGDPLRQVHCLLDIMGSFTERPEPCVCVVGMVAQERSLAHDELRACCARHLATWTGRVEALLEAARQRYRPDEQVDVHALAWWFNSLWQGAMLVAKTQDDPAIIRQSLELARRFIDDCVGPRRARRSGGTP